MDWMEQEQERGIHHVAATTAFCPAAANRTASTSSPLGHVDFTVEVEVRCASWTAHHLLARWAASSPDRDRVAQADRYTCRASCS